MAIINVSMETRKAEYPPKIVIGSYRCEILDEKGAVIGTSKTLDVVIDMPATPGNYRARLCRLDGSDMPLPGSEWTSDPFDVNQLVDVPKSATITVTVA